MFQSSIIRYIVFPYMLFFYAHFVMDFGSSGEEGEVKDDGSEAASETVGKMRSHPLVSVSIINPDEIPDVPKNQFLYRAGPENNDELRVERNRDRTRSTVRAFTKSGRKIKGRGSLVRLHPDVVPSLFVKTLVYLLHIQSDWKVLHLQ